RGHTSRRAPPMLKARLLLAGLLLLTVTLVGCADNNPNAPARISGSLTYKGQPIKAGTMAFHTPDGVSYKANLSPDGTYSATDIPVGELVATVETESINAKKTAGGANAAAYQRAGAGQQQPPPGVAAAPVGEYIKIPGKYANPKTSPLTVKISA